jgi:hypothetical protein
LLGAVVVQTVACVVEAEIAAALDIGEEVAVAFFETHHKPLMLFVVLEAVVEVDLETAVVGVAALSVEKKEDQKILEVQRKRVLF